MAGRPSDPKQSAADTKSSNSREPVRGATPPAATPSERPAELKPVSQAPQIRHDDKEKHRALSQAVGQIEKTFGKGSIMRWAARASREAASSRSSARKAPARPPWP